MTGARQWAVGLAMLAAAGLAVAVKPGDRMADKRPRIELESAIPERFGDWRVDASIAPIAPSPDVQAALDKIYSQMLSRTYINSAGERVMLSVAYGGDQSRSMQVHKPEVCYPMQGFTMAGMAAGVLDAAATQIPVMRLVATKGPRVEPITYWIAVGDTVVRGALEQNLARLKYGLTGVVPDGILVRVSTISRDERRAYELHRRFIADLLPAMRREHVARLLGTFGS